MPLGANKTQTNTMGQSRIKKIKKFLQEQEIFPTPFKISQP